MTLNRWIVIADAAHARLFAARGGAPWTFVAALEHPLSAAKTNEIVSDRAGRVQQRANPGRSAAARRTSPKQIEAEHFARELAKFLDTERLRYAQLVLIAPPRFLGLLRSQLSDSVRGAVATSLAQNWTDVPELELPSRLAVASA
jgi:protein required for attachment to host cells